MAISQIAKRVGPSTIGMTVEEAQEFAVMVKCRFRMVRIDGIAQPVIRDMIGPDLICVSVRNGKVVDVLE